MTKRFLWAALLVTSLLSFYGCSEVDSCERGEKGCLAGPCDGAKCGLNLVCATSVNRCGLEVKGGIDVGFGCIAGKKGCFGGVCDNGECEGKLVCDEEQLRCGVESSDGTIDVGGGEDGGGLAPLDCGCPEGEVCATDTKECIDFCQVPDVIPGSVQPPAPIFCEALEGETSFTFAQVCKAQCELVCQRWSQYCDFECPAGTCDDATVLADCTTQCPAVVGGTDPLTCLTAACNDIRGLGCGSQLECPDGKAQECDDVTCQNTCKFGFDGVCDDGDTDSAQFNECAWGSDCADCGPRRGEDEGLLPQGALCHFNSRCQGASMDFSKTEAWCVDIQQPVEGNFRCLPDCSTMSELCPVGYDCKMLVGNDNKALTDENGVPAQACIPNVCGPK